MIRSFLFSFIALPLVVVLLGGCLFEVAPTGPSRSNNTWLMGVWEFTAKDGTKKKAIVTPVESDWMEIFESDRMEIFYLEKAKGGKVKRQGQYPAWISRVGQASLLVVEVDGPEGQGYLLLGYQLLDPLTIRIREVTLNTAELKPGAYQLRKAIREAFKEGMLYRGDEEIWERTGEIYWSPEGNPAEHTFEPPRNVPPPVRPTTPLL